MENNIQNKLLPPGCLPPALSSGALLRTMYGTIWPVQKKNQLQSIQNKDNISQSRIYMIKIQSNLPAERRRRQKNPLGFLLSKKNFFDMIFGFLLSNS